MSGFFSRSRQNSALRCRVHCQSGEAIHSRLWSMVRLDSYSNPTTIYLRTRIAPRPRPASTSRSCPLGLFPDQQRLDQVIIWDCLGRQASCTVSKWLLVGMVDLLERHILPSCNSLFSPCERSRQIKLNNRIFQEFADRVSSWSFVDSRLLCLVF